MSARPLLRHLGAVACLTLLTVAYTWPLVLHLGTHLPVRHADGEALSSDQLFTGWILAHDVRRLLHDPLHIFESNNMYPFRHTLAYAENLVGVGALVIPVELIWRNPVLDHNVATLFCLVLTGWGMFLLVHELTGSVPAALAAGALRIYSPAVWVELPVLQMIAGQWVPIALFALVRLLRTGAWRWSIALALAVAVQAWSSLHHGLFLAFGLAVTTAVLLGFDRGAQVLLPQLVIAGLLAALLCVPAILPYRQVAWELDMPGRPGAAGLSLQLHRLAPPLGRPLGYLWERLRSGERIQSFATLVPYVFMAAGLIAAVVQRRPRVTGLLLFFALAAGAVANLLLALGPLPHPWLPTVYPLLATFVPGFGTLRAPVRAVSYVYLIACVVAGCGLAALLRRLSPMAARTAVAAAFVLIVVEGGWRAIPLVAAPPWNAPVTPLLARLEPGCAIAEVPTGFVSGALTLLRSTTHWRPVLNGYGGTHPVPQLVEMPLLNRFPAPETLAYLHEAGACAVVVRGDMAPAQAERLVAASRAAGFTVETAGPEILVRLPPAPPVPPPSDPRLPRGRWRASAASGVAADLALDGILETAWRGALRSSQGPQGLSVDLGAPARVSTLELELGRRFRLWLRTYRVEGSLDGEKWKTLAESRLSIPPLASYRTDPLRVVQRIPLTPARVRWLRIGPYRPAPPRGLDPDVGWEEWGVGEVHVRGVAGDAEATPSPQSRR